MPDDGILCRFWAKVLSHLIGEDMFDVSSIGQNVTAGNMIILSRCVKQ